ncbi:MAG TPA: response regulator, partial [Polyangiaceae bacterium]|nr:response regulator [Polyangiaceae bacterium]
MTPDKQRHDTEIPPRPATRERSVLVVDDEAAVAKALQRVLQAAGYDVTVASDGGTAVDKIMHQSFDVVLSDIQMPGMTGVDLLGIVRAYDFDVPVILMTGTPTLETAIEAIRLGALQYLPKPISNDTLVKAVARASQLHRMAQMKRDALKLLGETDTQAGDRAG